MQFLLSLVRKGVCPICQQSLFPWQPTDWCAAVGKDIHADCVAVYPYLTEEHKRELSEGKINVVSKAEFETLVKRIREGRKTG